MSWFYPVSGPISPITLNMLNIAPSAVGQGTWLIFATPSLWGGFFYNSTNADGDEFNVVFRCPPGIYTLRLNYWLNSLRGIMDVDIDGVEVGSIDAYAAVDDSTPVYEITGIQLSGGEHVITIRVDGKNVGSGGFTASTTAITLQKTG